MMKFFVPHNWHGDLISSIDLKFVAGFYGKLESDAVGGGRPSNASSPASKNTVEREVNKARDRSLTFDYLVNSSCLDNQELFNPMQRQMAALFDWLRNINVDAVTVSLPYLFLFIKKNYPNFRISVSTMAQVNTVDKAKFWEDLGASKITLSEIEVNRDFKLIEQIRKAVKCELQLIANNGCLFQCPHAFNHGLLTSHASQSGHFLNGFVVDFYRIMCMYKRLKDPVNFIRSDWIRPEDICYYEDLGIDYLKIVNRGMSVGAIKNILDAYTKRSYDGNLLDLLPTLSKNYDHPKKNAFYLAKYFFRPGLINILKLFKIKKAFSDISVYIDNKLLDKFLLSLQEKNCSFGSCKECGWCDSVARKAVSYNKEEISGKIKDMEKVIDEIVSGDMFRYL